MVVHLSQNTATGTDCEPVKATPYACDVMRNIGFDIFIYAKIVEFSSIHLGFPANLLWGSGV